MKTFNKRGDKGTTSLLYGARVSKNSPRCEAYGTVDEVVSALGLARSLVKKERTREIILKAQKELFSVGAELAVESADYERFISQFSPITEKMADDLESMIDELEAGIEMPKAFIIPGGNPGSAALDLSRSMLRRAERRTVSLHESGDVKNKFLLPYLNRLADLLFTLARYEEI
ncbi:MAG: cob(I)yrinic acid a,c-diamide adenosyltransferase [Dehalococcoidia bacterium]|nr:cob(I)yrinic acid a,c-diamide adenosyltransferase [Dehalococcoidia bacterium]